RSAHAGITRAHMIFMKPWAEDSMMARRRTKIPNPWFAVPSEEAVADQLVSSPLADNGAGDVTNVVLVETQHRADVGVGERLTRARYTIPVQPREIDAF